MIRKLFELPPPQERKKPKSPLNLLSFFKSLRVSDDAYYILSRFSNAAMYLLLFAAITSLSIVTLYHQYGLFTDLYARSGAGTLLDFYNYLIDFSGPPSLVLFCFYYYWLSRHVDIFTCDFMTEAERERMYKRIHKDDIIIFKITFIVVPIISIYISLYPSSLNRFFERSVFDGLGRDHYDALWFIYAYAGLAYYMHTLCLIAIFVSITHPLSFLKKKRK